MPKPETGAPASAPEPTPAAETPDHIDLAIDAWLREHIHNTPVSRDTEAYNHLLSVLPHLKAKLA